MYIFSRVFLYICVLGIQYITNGYVVLFRRYVAVGKVERNLLLTLCFEAISA